MKTTRTMLWATAAALFGGATLLSLPALRAADAPASTQPVAVNNAKCPVTGEDVDPKITSAYKGKSYSFCCADCVKPFQADPEKYLAKMK